MVDLNEPAGWIVIPLKDINERLVRKRKQDYNALEINKQSLGPDFHAADSSVAKPSTRKRYPPKTGD